MGKICNVIFYHGSLKAMFVKAIVLLLIPLSAASQDEEPSTDKYTKKVYQTEYAVRFKDIEDQKSFKKLREFLKQKQSLLAALKIKIDDLALEEYSTDTAGFKNINNEIKKLFDRIDGKKNTDSILIRYGTIYPNSNLLSRINRRNPDSLIKITVSEIRDKIVSMQNDIEEGRSQFGGYLNLEKNITNIEDDIDKCSNQIDTALAPEYQQQDFRKTISISFSVLIGLLLCIFFFIVYRRSDINLSKELLSGNGLQFITLFVLIIAVILFGILNILGSSELAAILSGISGYILGKGTQKDLSTAISERDKQ